MHGVYGVEPVHLALIIVGYGLTLFFAQLASMASYVRTSGMERAGKTVRYCVFGAAALYGVWAVLSCREELLALAGGVRLLSAPWRERTSRRNSLYALTDRRLIAITGEAALFFKGCSIYTRSFHKLRNVRLHPARNGAGDIILEYGGKKKVILREAARPQEAVDILKRLGQKQSSAEQEK